jgi:hypothetical protein
VALVDEALSRVVLERPRSFGSSGVGSAVIQTGQAMGQPGLLGSESGTVTGALGLTLGCNLEKMSRKIIAAASAVGLITAPLVRAD